MALDNPTLQEIQTNIIADIESELGQSIPLLAKAVFRILSYALAGAWIILYKYGTYQFNQRFPQLASDYYLEILGWIKGITRTPASTWAGQLSAISTTGTGQLKAGTQLINNNTGVVYTVDTAVALTIGTISFSATATSSGESGSLEVGEVIYFVSPLGGVNQEATVTAVTTQGDDKENIEDYRERVISAYHRAPQGGALTDYRAWAIEAPHIVSAYPYPATTPGIVDVYIEADDQTDGIPTSAEIAAALECITYDPITGLQTRRPVTAEVNVLAITRSAANVTITGLSPDSPSIREAIAAALSQQLLLKEPYIQGLSAERLNTITVAELISVAQTAVQAYSAIFTNMTFQVSGTTYSLYTLTVGEKIKLGIVAYA
ncbi:MAG: baseplate J/gp47 family protein [Spirochaetes bacterium]|nr:baseplate J/gp47 family protein [Spirochaetota bacterium]